MYRYVALLRGINVGGNNLIRMPALKLCFEQQRLRDVTTYIQSGNVLFAAADLDRSALTRRIERALSDTFGYPARITLRSFEEMRSIVSTAPKGFGARPGEYRYDVIFVRAPLTVDDAMQAVSLKPGVDRVWPGSGVFYFSRLTSKAAESRLPRIVGTPAYQDMTVRNWNTTKKLVELLGRAPVSGF